MGEWLYGEAGEIDVPSENLWIEISSCEAVTQPTRAFVANVANIRAIWKIYPHLIEQASINVARLCETVWQVTGKPLFVGDEPNLGELSEEVTRRIRERFERRYAETGSVEEAAGYDFSRGLERFEGLLEKTNNPDLQLAVFATLAGQIGWGYTAFETLAADLWKVVRDKQPSLSNEGPLQSQRKIQAAFKKMESAEIDSILCDPAIRRLALVRNVIMHKAAIVDQMFLDECDKIGWEVPDGVTHRIILTGNRVRELINPVVALGVSLIQATAKWLISL